MPDSAARTARRARARGVLLVALGVFTLVIAVPSVAVAATPDASGTDITVDVRDGGPSPSASPGPAGSSGPSAGSGSVSSGGSGSSGAGSGSGSSAGNTNPSNPANDPTVAPGEQVLLFVSGLTASGHPTVNPLLGGRVSASVSMHNLSSETFDAEVEFHADDVFGNELANLPTVAVSALEPNELRTIDANLGEVRISGLVHVYATITPLDEVEGAMLDPVERETWTVLPSWYVVGLLVAAAFSAGTWAYLRRRGL